MRVIDTTKGDDWYYINTKQNPADLITRGVMPKDLPSHTLWWQGPSWLIQDQTHWPTTTAQSPGADTNDDISSDHTPAQEKVLNICTNPQVNYSIFFDL